MRGPSTGLAGAYPENVLIGLLIVLLDLAAIGGLIVAIVVTAVRLRSSRLARRHLATLTRWTSLIVLVATLGLVVLGNVRFLISSYDQGRPAQAQVVGTWKDSDGARLQVLPDDTFVAAGLPADSSASRGGASTATLSYVFARYNAVDLWEFYRGNDLSS